MKLGIGTVQFGTDYGISNTQGRTPCGEVRKILAVARENGLRIIDTAALYGDSEKVLGETLPPDHNFSIITKTPKFPAKLCPGETAAILKASVENSLRNLRQKSIYGLLFHQAEDLWGPCREELIGAAGELQRAGLVQKIGVSVYTAAQIDRVLTCSRPDIIQLPVNVLDQRLLASGHLARLRDCDAEIHVRSAFLQGLLLMEPDTLPAFFAPVRGHLAKYRDYIRNKGLTPVEAALGFVVSIPEVTCVVCGVNNHQQFLELCKAVDTKIAVGEYRQFAFGDEQILNPSIWRIS